MGLKRVAHHMVRSKCTPHQNTCSPHQNGICMYTTPNWNLYTTPIWNLCTTPCTMTSLNRPMRFANSRLITRLLISLDFRAMILINLIFLTLCSHTWLSNLALGVKPIHNGICVPHINAWNLYTTLNELINVA